VAFLMTKNGPCLNPFPAGGRRGRGRKEGEGRAKGGGDEGEGGGGGRGGEEREGRGREREREREAWGRVGSDGARCAALAGLGGERGASVQEIGRRISLVVGLLLLGGTSLVEGRAKACV
jgi:hypothetical protein